MVLLNTVNEAKSHANMLREKMNGPKSRIKETRDYTGFKFFSFNRPIVKSHVAGLAESILDTISEEDGMLERFAIHVTEDLKVIDGQHRLKACESLQIPVKYIIVSNFNPKDIGRLNKNQLKWSRKNWMHYYAESGNKNYEKLREFMTAEKMRLTDTLVMLYGKNKNQALVNMEKGAFEWPDDTSAFHDHYSQVKQVIDLITRISPVQPRWLHGATFIQGISRFIKRPDVDLPTFLQRVETNLAWLKKCTKWEDLEAILLNIWNYRVRAEHHLKPLAELDDSVFEPDLFNGNGND